MYSFPLLDSVISRSCGIDKRYHQYLLLDIEEPSFPWSSLKLTFSDASMHRRMCGYFSGCIEDTHIGSGTNFKVQEDQYYSSMVADSRAMRRTAAPSVVDCRCYCQSWWRHLASDNDLTSALVVHRTRSAVLPVQLLNHIPVIQRHY